MGNYKMRCPQGKNQDKVQWNKGLVNEINEYDLQNAVNKIV